MIPRASRLAVASVALLAAAARARAELPRTFPAPPNVRACCAFGADLSTRVGVADIPLRLGNIVDPAQGRHSYDGRRRVFERNGLVYTCRGGFIDLAHVRDWADWTGFLYGQARELLGSGRTLELPDEAGARRIHFVAREVGGDRDALAMALARRLAFELSIWHEIASWYGYKIMPGYPERLSTFSPEDLYSNALGTWIGAQAARSDAPFDPAVDTALVSSLEALGALPVEESRAAMESVDGLWWDSTRFVPDPELVRRRKLDLGPGLDPWLVPEPPDRCGPAAETATVREAVPTQAPDGEPLDSYVALEIRPDPSTMEDFPLIDGELPVLSFDDLRWLTGRVRDDLRARFGPGVESPDGRGAPSASGAARADADGKPGSASEPPPAPAISSAGFDSRLLVGFRLLELSLQGGAAGDASGGLSAWGGSLEVVGADTAGGDVRAFVFDVHDDRDRRDVVVRFTVVESDALFLCRDRDTGETSMPVVAWFRSCEPNQVWGLGGTLGSFQYDGASGRSSIVPFELKLVANPFADGHSASYLGRRLLPFVGFGIDSVWPGRAGAVRAEADVSPRLSVGMLGLVRSPARRWEGRAFIGYRQDVSEAGDYTGEIGAAVERYFAITGDGSPDLLGLASVGLRTGWTYWSVPENSIQGWVGPFVSDRDEQSWQVMLTARIRPGALTF